MNYFLHINTTLEDAYVSLSAGDATLEETRSISQKEHASFLHPAVKVLLDKQGMKTTDLAAVSVIIGPGSYTGLRVGLSAAKGICFASGLPLISINTTEWMVASVLQEHAERFCPMIDARRKEVFTALYDGQGSELMPPFAHILHAGSFIDVLENNTTLFFGNGAEKCHSILQHPNARFLYRNPAGSAEQAKITHKKFSSGVFADLAYSEPLYVKEFYTTANNPH